MYQGNFSEEIRKQKIKIKYELLIQLQADVEYLSKSLNDFKTFNDTIQQQLQYSLKENEALKLEIEKLKKEKKYE